MRSDMDLDGDGQLNAKELLKLQRRLVAFATFGLKIRHGDTSVTSEMDEFRSLGAMPLCGRGRSWNSASNPATGSPGPTRNRPSSLKIPFRFERT